MNLILTIIGLFGIPSLYYAMKNYIFKYNIKFHKILKSFPLISQTRINDGSKRTNNLFTNIQISKELTAFVENKRGELDEFLAKLEKFDTSKLKFKKKEITDFTNNIKRLLTSKSANIEVEVALNLKTGEVTTNTSSEPCEWHAFNYIIVAPMIEEVKQNDKLFVCKMLNF